MKNKLMAALFATALACTATTLALAADSATSEPAKPLTYTGKWPSPDHFSVKSQDKQEVITMLKEHAMTHHDGMVLSDEKAEAMVKSVEPKK